MHIIGAGGHSKVVVEILTESNVVIDGVWEEDLLLKEFFGFPVLGNFESFIKKDISDVIIAIGSNHVRKRLSANIKQNSAVAIHPTAAISKSSIIGAGSAVMANASINADVVIGVYSIVNTNASIDHDCNIGDYVHIAPQVGLGGNVTVGEGSHIGIGTSVIQGVTIGKWTVIGAGTVIIDDIPDYAVVVGNPGKIIRYNIL